MNWLLEHYCVDVQHPSVLLFCNHSGSSGQKPLSRYAPGGNRRALLLASLGAPPPWVHRARLGVSS
jgi:hypothetical protein